MAVSLEQLATRPKPDLLHGRVWGVWQLDADRLVLVHGVDSYEIDLVTISSSAGLLDWVFQVQRWASPQEISDLIAALGDIFQPQANLCSGGADIRIDDPKRFLRTLLVIVSHMVDPRAHWIAPHQRSMIRLQQFRADLDVGKAGAAAFASAFVLPGQRGSVEETGR